MGDTGPVVRPHAQPLPARARPARSAAAIAVARAWSWPRVIVGIWIDRGFGALSEERLAVVGGDAGHRRRSRCSSRRSSLSILGLRRNALSRAFPGERRVWVVGGAVLALFAVVIVVAGLIPRDRYTGTNSVGVRSEVGRRQVRPDSLRSPARRARRDRPGARPRVLGGRAGRPSTSALQVAGGVRDGRGRSARRSAPNGASGPSTCPSGVSSGRRERPGTPVRDPAGGRRARSAGWPISRVTRRSPTVDGRELGSRVAVWFLPPAGGGALGVLARRRDRLARRPVPAGLRSGRGRTSCCRWSGSCVAYGALRLLAARRLRQAHRAAVGLIAFADGRAAGRSSRPRSVRPTSPTTTPTPRRSARPARRRREPRASCLRTPAGPRAAIDALRDLLPGGAARGAHAVARGERESAGGGGCRGEDRPGRRRRRLSRLRPRPTLRAYYGLTLPAYAAAGRRHVLGADGACA